MNLPPCNPSPHEITRILDEITHGDGHASEELLALVYTELRRLAASRMGREAAGQTLQPTALVHEAWMRLVPAGAPQPHWRSRAHFFGAAAEAMRRILIDRARRRKAQRHGGGQERVDVAEVEIVAPIGDDEVLAVSDALEKFVAEDPEKAELVKLRYFVGLSIEEAADVLGISERTAKRHWTYAKAWLLHEVRKG
jgi:RNA polymerase sigma factor (TIGR02999 family)